MAVPFSTANFPAISGPLLGRSSAESPKAEVVTDVWDGYPYARKVAGTRPWDVRLTFRWFQDEYDTFVTFYEANRHEYWEIDDIPVRGSQEVATMAFKLLNARYGYQEELAHNGVRIIVTMVGWGYPE